ncbi:spermidine synthase [Saccharomonospora piscinae]|uniref:spermidine synthase n=1 Tax=Saccharomonospora piscinae TaxID=687388 RepID=UPI001105CB41|nr:spermidine synthase [Saccharomonospora piscinae]TLW94695.1 spermidine synthase [Saccharomonospora piscinae]
MRFEELDWRATPLGELVLRRRWDPAVDAEVYEIKLDDEYLMSSLFTVSETELGVRGLAGIDHDEIDVVVGGLGLGYTAKAVLSNARVASLVVVDALPEVIEWHERGLIPAGTALRADPRCRLRHGDFFELVRTGEPFDAARPRVHAILVDIDHSPRHLLHPGHADLYTPAGLDRLRDRLHPGGVFALWSNDPPDEEFTALLTRHFEGVRAEVVTFPNPLQHREATSTLYLATTAPAAP